MKPNKILFYLIFILFFTILVSKPAPAGIPIKLIVNDMRINNPSLNEVFKDFVFDEINEVFFYEGISVIHPKNDEKKDNPFQLLNKYSAGYLIDGSITKIGENFSLDFKIFDSTEKKTKYFFSEGSGSKTYKENAEKLAKDIATYIFNKEEVTISSLKKKEKPKYVAKVEPEKVDTPEIKVPPKEIPELSPQIDISKPLPEPVVVPQLKTTIFEQKEPKQLSPETTVKDESHVQEIKEKTVQPEKPAITTDNAGKGTIIAEVPDIKEESVKPVSEKAKDETAINVKEAKLPVENIAKGALKIEDDKEKKKEITDAAKDEKIVTDAGVKDTLPPVESLDNEEKKYEKVGLLIFPLIVNGQDAESYESKAASILLENIKINKSTRFIKKEEAGDYKTEKLFLSTKKVFKRDVADYVGYGSIVSFAGEISFNFCIIDKKGDYIINRNLQLNSNNIEESLKSFSVSTVESINEKIEKTKEVKKPAEPKKQVEIKESDVKEKKEIISSKEDGVIVIKEVTKKEEITTPPQALAKTTTPEVKKPEVKEKKKEPAKKEKFNMKKSSKPLSVKSDTLEAFNKNKTVIFIGNVVAEKDDMTMYSDKLTVYYEEEGKEVKEIIAVANPGKRVKVVQTDRVATGKRAHFFRRENKVIMTGDPIVTQGDNSVAGDKITYFLDDEKSLVESGKEKRVNAIIYPKKVE